MSIDSQMNLQEKSIADRYNSGAIDEWGYLQEMRDMRKEFKEMAHEDAEDERRNEKLYS